MQDVEEMAKQEEPQEAPAAVPEALPEPQATGTAAF